MKGIIFNELNRMVVERFGVEAWERVLEETPLLTAGGAFIGPKTYPDEDLLALTQHASRILGMTVDQLVTEYGHFVFANLARLYPVFLKPGMTAKSFLKTVHSVIHVEVRKLYPDASLPSFHYEDPAPDRLVMIYQSPRKLCDFAAGLLMGVGEHFKERIDHRHAQCLKRGDKACRFELAFSPAVRHEPLPPETRGTATRIP